MNRLQSAINWVMITSGVSHVFCCGIPVVFSLLSLLSGMGMVMTMPFAFEHLHGVMHDYEIPMLIASGCILALGWGLHAIALKVDCRDTGCGHEPCGPKKKRSSKMLIVATLLFVFNVIVYAVFHH